MNQNNFQVNFSKYIPLLFDSNESKQEYMKNENVNVNENEILDNLINQLDDILYDIPIEYSADLEQEKEEEEKQDTSPQYDITKSLEQLFKDNGIDVIITSGYRPGAKTKNGNPSNHSKKDKYGRSQAHDIVPRDGDFNKLRQDMLNNEEIRNYFKANGLGVLDETTKEMLARTGGTGKHFHIGPDNLAKITWNKWLSLI